MRVRSHEFHVDAFQTLSYSTLDLHVFPIRLIEDVRFCNGQCTQLQVRNFASASRSQCLR
jgi:hypothetical protein